MFHHNKAYMAALLYTLIIGFSFMFVKIALVNANPADILAHRFTIAFLASVIVFSLNKTKLHITFRDFLKIFPLAMLYPTLFFCFQVFGLAYTASSQAGIVQACIPILTLIMATCFLKEHSTIKQNFFTLLSVVGVIYIFIMSGFSGKQSNTFGIILIFLSALSASCYNVLARTLTQKYSTFVLTYFMTIFGMAAFNMIAIINHLMNHTLASYFTPLTNISFLLSMLYLGILSSLCTAFLSNYALSKMEASKMSVFSNLATLITILAGVIFLKEHLQYFHIIGAVFILCGVIGTNYFSAKNKS
ncbi:DMT family transporter [Pectinatus sottacetonis]|uniref:DMT family transporter n=1 Tax=Pectinatus sottacetonis TaxID=1002795 RepID=UPI0018C474BB|nr:DMT family transporter [Pectinatus sottacetonis]